MLPNLLIIGAMKCGTTSLHNYLNFHPEIYMTKEKELNYFVDSLNYGRGLSWYKSKFNKADSKVLGESSPNYSKYPLFKNVPKNIHNTIPDTKLIYIVRDPIQRLISHYKHNFIVGREKKGFKEALRNLGSNKYINFSMYYLQISKYLEYFNIDNIFVLDSELLLNKRIKTMQSIFEFLEVQNDFISDEFNDKFHITYNDRVYNRLGVLINKNDINIKSSIIPRFIFDIVFTKKARIPEVDNNTIDNIKTYLSKDSEKFVKLTGQDFYNWYII